MGNLRDVGIKGTNVTKLKIKSNSQPLPSSQIKTLKLHVASLHYALELLSM